MTHKKNHHEEKISICWKFSAGFCEYGEKLCWFSHVKSTEDTEPTKVSCNICSKTFNNLNDFLHHKKQKHGETVKECKQNLNKKCRFGEHNCWFHHEKEMIVPEKGNQEMTEKLVNMMETFSQRMVEIENHINYTN